MIQENLARIRGALPEGVKLVAVSKFHPVETMMEAYEAGQRCFAENRPQEFCAKVPRMPSDVEWHFTGHIQTNKLKLVLPYARLVQSVDSLRLLQAIDRWGAANDKTINALLQFHLGAEETKGGFDEVGIVSVLREYVDGAYDHVRFRGLMGMATFTDDESVIRADFARIRDLKQRINAAFPRLSDFTELSIGMSGDWRIALEYGATIIRIGTAIFGHRQY
ncbi:MAG: YggS family pyridoxal phosphate-dependent enzyme [Candidatus Cryptobacteroides sp.]|jgi:pyridoxal phosphate enzyme (YggS family)